MQHTAPHDTQAQQHAYQAAFEELGLEGGWNPSVHGAGAEGLRNWLRQERPHLLRVYDEEFLVEAVESTRERLARTR